MPKQITGPQPELQLKGNAGVIAAADLQHRVKSAYTSYVT